LELTAVVITADGVNALGPFGNCMDDEDNPEMVTIPSGIMPTVETARLHLTQMAVTQN